MKYTEKFNVMWDVERNTDTIFEMVISKIIKNIIPAEDKEYIGDNNIAETFKTLTEVETYEDFCEKFEGKNNAYATFIIALVENINDINIFKFDSLSEDQCVLEANNDPHLIHHEVIPSLDDELTSFELTKNLKHQIAGVIKDDLEKQAQEADSLEKIKDDLDDIDVKKEEDDKEKAEEEENEEPGKLEYPEEDENDDPIELPEDVKQDMTEAYGGPNTDVITFMMKKKAKLSKQDIEHIVITHLKLKDKAVATKLSLLINAAFDGIVNNVQDTFNGRSRGDRYSTPEEAVEICDLALAGKLGQYTKPIFDFIYDEMEGTIILNAVVLVSVMIFGFSALTILIIHGFAFGIAIRDIVALFNGLKRSKQVIIESVKRIDEEIDELEATKSNSAKLAALKETRAKLAKNSGIRDLEIYSFQESIEFNKPEEVYEIDMAFITENMVTSISTYNGLQEIDSRVLEAAVSATASSIILIEMLGLKTHKEMQAILAE